MPYGTATAPFLDSTRSCGLLTAKSPSRAENRVGAGAWAAYEPLRRPTGFFVAWINKRQRRKPIRSMSNLTSAEYTRGALCGLAAPASGPDGSSWLAARLGGGLWPTQSQKQSNTALSAALVEGMNSLYIISVGSCSAKRNLEVG
jgi:hypothetical protein